MKPPKLFCTECADVEGEAITSSHVCSACGFSWCLKHHQAMEDGEPGACCPDIEWSVVSVEAWATRVTTALRLMRAAPVVGRG